MKKIYIKEKVVTIDTIGSQTYISDLISDKKGLYILCVKGNQITLMAETQERTRKKSFKRVLGNTKKPSLRAAEY
ncbi:MAG: hypothetical protein LUG24_08275 [Clostridiales bacterium]|nr:hypothetical protein [Clostridiales bacterium]